MDEPLVLMTQRKRLDAYLVEQAVRAGAEFRDGVKVSDLALEEGGVQAQVDGSRVAATHALLADGANGVSARAIGLDDGRDYGVALEANVPYGVVSEAEYRGLLCLELANVPGGYGWVFPKGDHVNVGVGGWEREGPRLRRAPGALLPRVRHSGVEPGGRPRPPASARPPTGAVREGARRAPRRRRGARRPALRRRHLRGVSLGQAGDRSRPRRRSREATTESCGARSPPSSPPGGAPRSPSTASRGSRTRSSARRSSGTRSCRCSAATCRARARCAD